MLSLVYVSSAKQLFTEDDLKALLQKSHDNNMSLGLTGMLLYKDGDFMQAVEGPDEALETVYAKIRSDPRHRGILELTRRQIEQREFPSWSMGFKNLNDAGLQSAQGFSSFMNEPLTSPGFHDDPTRAQMLLRMFREQM
jgi:hypothetical protein